MRLWLPHRQHIKKHIEVQFSINPILNNKIEKNQLKQKKKTWVNPG
jgi:hypothetical protein